MHAITLFNAYKKVVWKIRRLDIKYERLFQMEKDAIARNLAQRARYERLERKLNLRLSHFLKHGHGTAPRASHCVICGRCALVCGCDEYHPPHWERE